MGSLGLVKVGTQRNTLTGGGQFRFGEVAARLIALIGSKLGAEGVQLRDRAPCIRGD